MFQDLIPSNATAFPSVAVTSGVSDEGHRKMKPELYTVSEFLTIFAISRSEFYREVNRGNIRLLKLNSASRIRREDAEAWAASLPTYQGEAA
jgi:hypothetical protein